MFSHRIFTYARIFQNPFKVCHAHISGEWSETLFTIFRFKSSEQILFAVEDDDNVLPFGVFVWRQQQKKHRNVLMRGSISSRLFLIAPDDIIQF